MFNCRTSKSQERSKVKGGSKLETTDTHINIEKVCEFGASSVLTGLNIILKHELFFIED